MSLEILINKGGSRTTWFRRLRDYTFTHSDLLWSRGWYRHVDHAGDCSFLYRAFPTRYPVDNLSCLRGKKGLIWLRLGNYPIRKDWGNQVKNRIGDVATFDRDVIGKLGGPTILITTDGDMSVPGDLPNGVAERILDDPNIYGWFTQNYDGSLRHKKLFPIPIGLGLHVGITNRLKGVNGKSHLFNQAMNKRLKENDRIPRIWSDTHLRTHPGFFGDPRETLALAIQTKSSFKYLDFPSTYIPQKEIWENYGRYRFVISLPGHGLDCYRTWEALALGACVITVASPLDELLHNYRVVSLNIKTPNDWSILNSEKWMQHQFDQLIKKPVVSLSWRPWIKQIRDLLEKH